MSQPAALTVQVIEDSGDDVGIFNARNESYKTPALLTDFNIYPETNREFQKWLSEPITRAS